MGEVWGKSHDIRLEEAHSSIRDASGDSMRNALALIDDKLNYPSKISLSTVTITIGASVVQNLKSAGTVEGTSSSIIKAALPIGGAIIETATSTLNVSTGAVTGDFETTPTSPTVTANEYIYLGFENRADSKIYVRFGASSNANPALAPKPTFTSTGAGIGYLLLQKDGTTGTWSFLAPVETTIRQFYNTTGGSATSFTDIPSDVYPDAGGTRDLGTLTNYWKDFYTQQVLFDNGGILYQDATTKLLMYKSSPSAPAISLGSGGAGSDLIARLFALELGIATYDDANSITDTFNTNQGTKTDLIISSSALRHITGDNAGTQQYNKPISTKIGSVEGYVVRDITSFRPLEETIANGATYIRFPGDVRDYFPASTNVVIHKQETYEGGIVIQPLLDATNNPALIAVNGTPTYDSGNDRTTVNLTVGSLNINCGLSTAADIYAKLRMRPFDFETQVCTQASGSESWEDMELKEISSYQGQIGLPGDSYIRLAGDLSGTALRVKVTRSKNGTYRIATTVEDRGGTDYMVVYHSSDAGKTYTKTGETTLNGTMVNEDTDNRYQTGALAHVADNGKFFIAYNYYNGSVWHQLRGVYGDITSPSLTATPDVGAGSGIISGEQAYIITCSLDGDATDGSYIALINGNGSTNITYLRSYTSAGAVHNGVCNLGAGSATTTRTTCGVLVTGSGTTHTAHYFHNLGTHDSYHTGYVTEAAPTTDNNTAGMAPTTRIPLGFVKSTNYIWFLTYNTNTYGIWSVNRKDIETHTWGTEKNFGAGPVLDDYNGRIGIAYLLNHGWYIPYTLVVDPNDENHIQFVSIGVGWSSRGKLIVFDVEDIASATSGYLVSQTNSDVFGNPLRVTGQPMVCQTVTMANSTTCRSFGMGLQQIGSIAKGKKVWLEIYNTSAGVPTTQITDARSQDVEASEIEGDSSFAEHVIFNFPASISLSIGTVYAFVLNGDFDISASNYLKARLSSSNPYAGGSIGVYDGANWTMNTTYDWYFFLCEQYVTLPGGGKMKATTGHGNQEDCEAQIVLKDSYNSTIIYRESFSGHGDEGRRSRTGVPHLINATIEAAGVNPTLSAKKQIAYNKYDPNLAMNISFGNAECFNKSLTAGTDTGDAIYDRSSNGLFTASISGTITRTVNADFLSGYSYLFSSNGYVRYTSNSSYWMDYGFNQDYAIEAEIDLNTTIAAVRCILMHNNASGSTTMGFRISSGGYLEFRYYLGADYITRASDKTEPLTPHRVRVTRQNGIVKLWRAETAPYTTFTEVASYSVNDANNRTIAGDYAYTTIGAQYDDSSAAQTFLTGELGYFKLALAKTGALDETSPFTYDGYSSQSAVVSPWNLGDGYAGKQIIGDTNTTATEYDEFIIGDGQESAVVDGYILKTKWDKTLSVQGTNLNILLSKNRGVDTDQTNEKGIIFQGTKV